MTTFTIILVAIPIATTLALLVWFATKRRKREEAAALARRVLEEAIVQAQSQLLPAGWAQILPPVGTGNRQDARHFAGKFLVVLAGTFAAKVGLKFLQLAAACGLEQAIGSILLIELDADRRAEFIAGLPQVFSDRLIVVTCPALSGGGMNRPLNWIRAHTMYWMAEIVRGALDVCDLHQRRSSESNEAAQVLPFVSLGTTGYMGKEALKVIMERFDLAQCVGFTSFPNRQRLRARAREILQAYIALGCHGFICSDDLPDEAAPGRSYIENDLAMVSILVGLLAATCSADGVTEVNNFLTGLLPVEPGGLASFSTYSITIPAHSYARPGDVHPDYYIDGNAMVAATLRALRHVGDDTRKAVSAPFGLLGTSRADIVLAPVEPASLRSIQDDTLAALQTVARAQPDEDLFFAGTRTLIDPKRPTCQITVVSVQALADPNMLFDRLERGQHSAAQLSTVAPSTNGHMPHLDPEDMEVSYAVAP